SGLGEREYCMLGEQIGQTTGKRLVRRVLSTNPLTVEVSFEDSGALFGVAVSGIGTYTSVASADGSLHGSGQGMEMTADGESATWTGTGVGKFGPGGSAIAACFSSGLRRKSSPASITPAPLSNMT